MAKFVFHQYVSLFFIILSVENLENPFPISAQISVFNWQAGQMSHILLGTGLLKLKAASNGTRQVALMSSTSLSPVVNLCPNCNLLK